MKAGASETAEALRKEAAAEKKAAAAEHKVAAAEHAREAGQALDSSEVIRPFTYTLGQERETPLSVAPV